MAITKGPKLIKGQSAGYADEVSENDENYKKVREKAAGLGMSIWLTLLG